MSEEHVSDLIPAYALGSLDLADKHYVEGHLESCVGCREELNAYQMVMEDLVLAVPQVEPPKNLKKSILRAIETEKGESHLVSLRKEGSGQRRWLDNMKPLLPIWSIASLILVFVLGTATLLLFRQVKDLSQKNTMVFSEFIVIPLNGTAVAPQATGIMVISNKGLNGSLNVDGLPPLDSGHQYQLWLLQEGRRTNGGVFSVTPNGNGTLKVNSSLPLIINSIGITIEPTGGSPGPTGDKVLGGGL